MSHVSIHRTATVRRTPRVMQLEGLFDLPATAKLQQSWEFDWQLPAEWNIGLIVGPSGSGKSTVARELFGERVVDRWDWPSDQAVIDGFPQELSIKEVVGLLSAVGFSSPPSWIKPFAVLSTGEQFRVHVARSLAERPDLVVIDEFTSVVDRTVARIGSVAIAREIRRRNSQFVAVTCHADVIEWLNPDWVFEPQLGRLTRRSLRRRPALELEITRATRASWKLFQPHHYLSAAMHPAARRFVALVEGRPAALTAVLAFPHPKSPGWREHRTVCLPDFQGVGIGHALSEFVASLFTATGRPYGSTTSHPGMIGHRQRSPLWRQRRAPRFCARSGHAALRSKNQSLGRIVASFEYVGPARTSEARAFGII